MLVTFVNCIFVHLYFVTIEFCLFAFPQRKARIFGIGFVEQVFHKHPLFLAFVELKLLKIRYILV